MPLKKWPFPGDSPTAKARKMCLAFRAVALEDTELLDECVRILDSVNRRLVSFSDPEVLKDIDGLLERIRKRETPSQLDKRFHDWGEEWHAEIPVTYEEDDYVTARQGAPLINISANTLGELRIKGRIQGVWDKTVGPNGGWTFRVGDIWKLQNELRGRNWRAKSPGDSISDNGRGDPE